MSVSTFGGGPTGMRGGGDGRSTAGHGIDGDASGVAAHADGPDHRDGRFVPDGGRGRAHRVILRLILLTSFTAKGRQGITAKGRHEFTAKGRRQ